MSYTPGQVIQTDTEQALVLTEGKILLRLVDGKPHREIMQLADWLLIASSWGKVVQVQGQGQAQVQAQVQQEPEEQEEPGTTLRWSSADADADAAANRATAIVLDEGKILQVCHVINGLKNFEKKRFDSVNAWKQTFQGGNFTSTPKSAPHPRTPGSSSHQTKVQRLNDTPVEAVGDLALLEKITRMWHISSIGRVQKSYNQQIIELEYRMNRWIQERDAILPTQRGWHYSDLLRYIREYKHAIARLRLIPDDMRDITTYSIHNCSKQRLYATVAGRLSEIVVYQRDKIISTATPNTTFNSLAEMNVDLDSAGKPLLHVLYRDELVRVNL